MSAKKAANPRSPSSRVSDAVPLTTVFVTVAAADGVTVGRAVVIVGVTFMVGLAVTTDAFGVGVTVTVGLTVMVGVTVTVGGPVTSVVFDVSKATSCNTTTSPAKAT